MSQNTFISGKMLKSGRVCTLWSILVYFLILLDLTTSAVKAYEGPATDFSRHSIVRPTFHHGRTKREIATTRDSSGTHHPEVTLTVTIDGTEYVLDLRLNHDLVPDNHVLSYQRGGQTVHHKPKAEELDLCQYSGSVRGRSGSWAAVSTCHGVRGVIYDGEAMRYIEPQGNDIQSDHMVYDHSDLTAHHRCGYEGVTRNDSYDPLLFKQHHDELARKRSRASRYKRDTEYEAIKVREPYNANKLSRYVELVLVVDNGEYRASGEDINAVHRQMKDLANIINSVYAPLNIFIALVGVVVWTERDEIQLLENGDETLNKFLHYRKTVLLEKIPNDNAQLVTSQNFKDSVVGKALKGFICSYEYSAGLATNHSKVLGLVAMTIAHEMGHNFGMEHDTETSCVCPDSKCIMSPSTSNQVTPVHWSSCSLKSLALSFERGMDYCLRNKPKSLFDSPTCGNGFLEEGEECDCGSLSPPGAAADCRQCCQDDCTLRSNATCGHGACCDLTTCRPKAAGTECRAADRECDLPEYCTGVSQFCPSDVYKMAATPCANNQAYCYEGTCRTHTDQCRLLWGSTGESSDQKCYRNSNTKGNEHGNCGYDRVRQIYKRCADEDAMCGLLQCRHLNERLEFGMEHAAVLSATFINVNSTIIPCRTVMVDLGLADVDPGLAPDGAKCGLNKMCLNQKCESVESVIALVAEKGSVCPSNCSGHGICNSKGNCHCDPGFAPPICALPGSGGSYESGPATDPTVQRNFMVAMYIIFLGIIPSVLLVLFLIYYSRHNVLMWWKKPRKSVQSPKKTSLQHRISRSASKFAANFQNHAQASPQPVNVHTLSNPDDMSSSLLRSDSDRSPNGNINPSVNFFGNFKGFSLTPMDKNQEETSEVKNNEPVPNKSAKITPIHRSSSNSQNLSNQGVLKPVLRSAPPLPVVPTGSSPKTSPSVKRTNSAVQNRIKALMNPDKEDLTSVSTNPPPRPVISSPILEASTCTAKELISPLQGSKTLGPIRAAPTAPTMSPDLPKRPLSMHASTVPQKPLPEEPKKVKEGISLNRIASFLKQDKPKEKQRNPVERSHSMPKNPNHIVKVPKPIDKVALRNLQISNPILQKNIELPVGTVPVISDSEDAEDPKAFVNRAQSMRIPMAPKAPLQTFGSMRQPSGAPRPVSGVGRPTAPPPPLPNQTKDEPPVYQNPKPLDIKSTDYVDCIEEKQAPLAHIDEEGDNIYAIIEESPEKHSKPLPGVPPPIKTIPQAPPVGYNTPKPIATNSGSTESMGLLGEIVNEIQTRNFDSIYSASTLSRKKKDKEKIKNPESNRDSTYMNTAESVYSNSGGKSVASTTSSGYLHPSAVNVPTYLNKQEKESKEAEKVPPPPQSPKANSKIPQFSRQVTPPYLKNTSTFKSVPQSPKSGTKNTIAKTIVNSPDVVSSCQEKTVKAPDVINNNKVNETPKVAVKPSITTKPNDNRPPLRPAPTVDKKPNIKPALKPVNANTNKPVINRTNSKVDSNIAAIADNLNKNKPKVVPKPTTIGIQRTDSNVKPNASKLTSKPSNVASLQQKFENRKSIGKEPGIVKK